MIDPLKILCIGGIVGKLSPSKAMTLKEVVVILMRGFFVVFKLIGLIPS